MNQTTADTVGILKAGRAGPQQEKDGPHPRRRPRVLSQAAVAGL